MKTHLQKTQSSFRFKFLKLIRDKRIKWPFITPSQAAILMIQDCVDATERDKQENKRFVRDMHVL